MYTRLLENTALKQINKRKCLTLVGPRQSGKTTLCKKLFPGYKYISFESPDTRGQFEYDPRGFLSGIKGDAILDGVQKVPELLSYLQEINNAGDEFAKPAGIRALGKTYREDMGILWLMKLAQGTLGQ